MPATVRFDCGIRGYRYPSDQIRGVVVVTGPRAIHRQIELHTGHIIDQSLIRMPHTITTPNKKMIAILHS